MDATKAKGKRTKPAAPRSRASDALVVLAMTLVTVALAIGLYLQFRLAFWLALVAALSVYIGLLTLHALVRRSERVGQLTAEVERLEEELSALRRGGAQGGLGTGAAKGVAAGAATAAAGSDPAGRTGPVEARTAPAAPARGEPKSVAPAPAPSPTPAVAPVRRDGEPAVPAAAAADAWALRPADEPRLAGPVAVLRPSPSPAASGRPPMERSEPKPGPRDAEPSRPVAPPPLPAAVEAAPEEAAIVATVPVSRREADVEMIQGLIKKLADEVNAAEASLLKPSRAIASAPGAASPVPVAPAATTPPAGPAAPVAPSTAAAIERSVNALRTTADTMRVGAPAGGTRDTARSGTARSEAMVGAETAARARLRAAAPSAEAAVSTMQPSSPPAVPPPLPPNRAAAEAPPAAAVQHRLPDGPALTDRAAPGRLADPAPTSFRPVDPRLPEPAAGRPSGAGASDLGPMPPPLPWPEATDVDAEALQAHAAGQSAPSAHARLAALAEAITAGRFDVILDPILGLVDQRARHFEIALRLRDKAGQVLDPPENVPELRESGLLPLLDCARLTRSAQFSQRLADRGKDGSVFSVFSGEALSHDQFLSDFAEAVGQREALSGQLVLSFAQSDVRGFTGRDWETLGEMRELGFRFSLQSVTDLDMDFEALKAAGFDFVKLDALVFLEGMHAAGGIIPTADICRHLSALGMTLIVGEIDSEADLARIFGFGVIYGQGRLFGGARPVKAEALASAETAAA